MVERVAITTTAELRRAIDRRRRALRLTMLALDDAGGLQSGYAAKLLGPSRIKSFGEMSLPAVLGALGLSLAATREGKPEPLEAIYCHTLLRIPHLREALNIHIELLTDDAAIPAITRAAMKPCLSIAAAHRQEGVVHHAIQKAA